MSAARRYRFLLLRVLAGAAALGVLCAGSTAVAATVAGNALQAAQERLDADVEEAQRSADAAVAAVEAPSSELEDIAAMGDELVQLASGAGRIAPTAGTHLATLTGLPVTDAADALRPRLRELAADAEKSQEAVAAARRRVAAFERASAGEVERAAALDEVSDEPSPVPGKIDPSQLLYGFGGPNTAGVSAQLLDDHLESVGSPMAGSGMDFLRSGLRWRIDPRLLVAIAGAESAYGNITCAPYNAWGWGCPAGPYSFSGWDDAIDTVAKGLRTGYLNSGRTSTAEIHAKYAPAAVDHDPNGLNLVWAVNVNTILLALGGDPADVRGVSAAAATTGR